MKDPVYGAFTAMPVHAFESKPLVMSRYWYALESVRGHSRESSIHGITRERLIARPLRYRSVPLYENETERNGTGTFFLTRTVVYTIEKIEFSCSADTFHDCGSVFT